MYHKFYAIHVYVNMRPRPHGSVMDYVPLTILLMAEILHHLGCKEKPENNGIDYQPQLASRISSINRYHGPSRSLEVTP